MTTRPKLKPVRYAKVTLVKGKKSKPVDDLETLPARLQTFLRPTRVGALNTLPLISRESAKVYRSMRRGELAPEVGCRWMFALTNLASLVKTQAEIEELKQLNSKLEAVNAQRMQGSQDFLPADLLEPIDHDPDLDTPT